MIDAIRVACAAVRAQGLPRPGELAVVELEAVAGILIGIDDFARTHLLLQMDADEQLPTTPDIATLEVAFRQLVVGTEVVGFTDVTCLFESMADVFEHFASAVAERATDDSTPVRSFGEVLERWRQFLVRAGGPPGRARIASTFGELLLLRDIVHVDRSHRVDCWVGPTGGRHDFRRGAVAIEVKTTLKHTSREVTIHGEDQLAVPLAGTLHLHLVRLEEVPSGGDTLPSLVDDLLTVGADAHALFGLLAAAGIPAAELALTAEVSFDVRERITFPVDDAMPRIVPESFVGGERPVGVTDVTYVIDLDHCLDHALDATACETLMNTIGSG